MRRLWILGAALLLPACGGGSSGGGTGTTSAPALSGAPRALVFVAAQDTWWAEYKVAVEVLRAAGWEFDVRSSAPGVATSYQTDGTIESSADSLAGSSYAAFLALMPGWDPAWNAPADIPLDGRIQDVGSMAGYELLVIAGGTGAVDYRYDGSYPSAEVQAAAERLQQLIGEGKPVIAQCHGATLPAFARVPGTVGSDGLGESRLQGRAATGFPGGDTAAVYAALGVLHRPNRPVVLDTLSTTRDWYPQTIVHGMRGVLKARETAPSTTSVSVLILHGGAFDATDPGNDIPANYGTVPASLIPADYLDLEALLEADSPADAFTISVADVDLRTSTPLDFSAYDVVLVFKHWSTNFPAAVQTALRDYVEAGGGLVALHHAVYNQIAGAANKNVLCREILGVESAAATWSARNPAAGPFGMINVNYGHFVSTHGVAFGADAVALAVGTLANASASGYPRFTMTDEIYDNTAFVPGAPGTVEPLFANDYVAQPGQVPTAGFARISGAGRLVFLEPGERAENFQVASPYGQVVRNAVVWAGQ